LAEDGVVTLDVTEEHGIWLSRPDGKRLFLGATEVFPINKSIH